MTTSGISKEDSTRLLACINRLKSFYNYKTAAYVIKKLFLEQNIKIVIYGAGLHTKKLFEYFDKNDFKNITAIADGNKCGFEICGIDVLAASKIVELEFDYVILSSDVNQANMAKELLSFNINDKKIIDIYKIPEFYSFCDELYDGEIDSFADKINRARNPLVVTGLAFQLNHLALFDELSRHYDLFVFCVNDRLSQSIEINNLKTNYVFKKLENADEVFYIIRKITIGKIITIHGCRDISFGAGVIVNANVDVFCMVIDVLSSMFLNEEDAVKLFGEKAEDDWFCEQFCWNYGAGFIHKDEPSVLSSLVDRYGKKNSLQFLNYTSKKEIVCKGINFENPKFVYAGGIHAASDKNDGSTIQNSVLDIAKAITKQGYEFHIYNAYDNGTSGKWDEFLDEARVNLKFFYNYAVSPDMLVEAISKFDIAISVFDFSNRLTKADFHTYAFPTRLIAFLEAGLPVVLSNELSYAVGFVEELHIGIGIDLAEIDDIGKMLQRFDMDNFKANVEDAASKLSYKNNIHKLVDFINRETR